VILVKYLIVKSMKFVSKWVLFTTLFAAILVLNGCGGDDPEKSEEEVQLDKLRGSWTMTSVENDGIDRSEEYPGMKISLSGSYTENGTYGLSSEVTDNDWPSVSPWKAIDSWKFDTATPGSIVVRQSDLTDLNYTLSNSDSQLRIEFSYAEDGFNNGRTASVGGNWVFTFTK
jgi:hypothetical protein